MAELYPLLLKPEFRERIWGTRDLSPLYAEVPGTALIGEVWLTGDDCQVVNGPLAGTTLGQLCRRFGGELVGASAREPNRFPLLIKFLFPREKLSVQLHPDDEEARRLGLPCGKTECWYVVKAEPGAQVGLGLKPGTTRQQFAQAIREVRAEQLLNWIDIHAGEMIYVDAGTVHTIGPGSILLETQQNSDTTFRLYDYGRPRELHVEQGLQALKEQTRAGKVEAQGEDDFSVLVNSPWFMIDRQRLKNEERLRDTFQFSSSNAEPYSWRSVEIFVALDGYGVVEAKGCEPVGFGRGEAVVVPASIDNFCFRAQWELEMLSIVLPPKGTATEPRTSNSSSRGLSMR